jgi:hypothetical protein
MSNTDPQHPFPPGTVVRSYGDQYPEAYQRGTATVIRSFRRGQWLEYEVGYHPENPWRRLTGKDRSEWSSERTFAIDDQPARCESQGCVCGPYLPCDEACSGEQFDDGSSVHCQMCQREMEEMIGDLA